MVVMVMTAMVMAVMTSPSLADEPSIFPGCFVSPALNISVGKRRAAQVEFWGFVGSAASGSVMNVEVGEEGGFGHTRMSLTHTHATATRVGLMGEGRQQWRVAGRVAAGWRRFLLEATWWQDALRLNLTDDHGTAWLANAPPQGLSAAQWVRVVVPHFNTTCQALTPVWHVEAGAPTKVPLPPLARSLQFTVMDGTQPRLMLHHTEISLAAAAGDGGGSGGQDARPPGGPLLLRLTMDHTKPAAPPRLVPTGLRGVVEVTVDGPLVAMWLSGGREDAFHVVQQLHVSSGTQVIFGDAAPHPWLVVVSWPVVAGVAAALLVAGMCVGAGVCRLVRTRAEAAAAVATRPKPQVHASLRKSESPYLEPRRGLPPSPASALLKLSALPGSPAVGLEEWRSAAVVVAPRKSVSMYLQPRVRTHPGPWPALDPSQPRCSSPGAAYEYVYESTATDSYTSDDRDGDDRSDELYSN